ncbi:MAG: GNAT family N-acetyltransferase, partial [Solirubrobacteraceae bacterium]
MPALSLRPLTASDLDLVRDWIKEPHVARWYLSGSTIEEEVADLERCVAGEEPTHALVVVEDG